MRQTKLYLYQALSDKYQGDELNALVWWVLEELTRKNRANLLADTDLIIYPKVAHQLPMIVERLLADEPIQYIFGHCLWNGLDLLVDKNVLIPRPETAQIIQLLTKSLHSPSRIVDIGTGSGCLAIALKQTFPHSEVVAFDISAEALHIAAKNAMRNNVDIELKQVDILKPYSGTEQYDLIVSNPPYIMNSEKGNIEKNVLDYEPELALFVPDDDPLLFYRHIAIFASQHLVDSGCLVLEINQQLGEETQTLVSQFFPSKTVELVKDDYSNDRFVIVNG